MCLNPVDTRIVSLSAQTLSSLEEYLFHKQRNLCWKIGISYTKRVRA